ncbi:MAG: hypothetical protein QE485_17220 [Acidovorax sp.]|uniref:hypothetical protein n=1 Tax=Acidovorax sp. TaxID=1872122 RepID=UPI002638C4FC|nr:hypothetical protein [Acidovorax sp.]MDH4418954.1 hypothetical protein [Acidovorax sp.]
MTAINIQPHSGDVNLGTISTDLHIYAPGREIGYYNIKIGNNPWQNGLNIQPGNTQTYHPNGAKVLINNWGMTRLQALFGFASVSCEEAGLEVSVEERDISHQARATT